MVCRCCNQQSKLLKQFTPAHWLMQKWYVHSGGWYLWAYGTPTYSNALSKNIFLSVSMWSGSLRCLAACCSMASLSRSSSWNINSESTWSMIIPWPVFLLFITCFFLLNCKNASWRLIASPLISLPPKANWPLASSPQIAITSLPSAVVMVTHVVAL